LARESKFEDDIPKIQKRFVYESGIELLSTAEFPLSSQ